MGTRYKYSQDGISKIVQKLENERDDLGFLLATMTIPRNRAALRSGDLEALDTVFDIIDRLHHKRKTRWKP